MSGGLRRGNWSVQELERLRQLLPRRGVEAMAMLLRRSPASVQRKATELLQVPPRRGDWTASDDELLRDAYGALDPRLLAVVLGRQIVDIRRRVAVLRATQRSGAWTRAERQRLKDLYGTRTDEDLEVCLSRSREAIVAMAQKLCLAKDKRFAAHVAARQAAGASAAALAEPGALLRARMPRWSPAETERLRALYPDRDNLTVAKELGRTVTSVANKANQLGLKKSPGLLADIGRANVGVRYGRAGEGELAAEGG